MKFTVALGMEPTQAHSNIKGHISSLLMVNIGTKHLQFFLYQRRINPRWFPRSVFAKSEPAPVSQLVLVDRIAVATGLDGELKEGPSI
jgi:hypothetical protein